MVGYKCKKQFYLVSVRAVDTCVLIKSGEARPDRQFDDACKYFCPYKLVKTINF